MNRFQFKIMLVIFMVLDHIAPLLPSNIGIWMHPITRFVAVGFSYLAVEGFQYTSNAKKYIERMYIAAAVMQLGNFILNTLMGSKGFMVYNNIFLTLALGLSILYVLKMEINNILKVIILLALFGLGIVFSESGNVVIPFMILTYIFRKNIGIQFLSYFVLSVIIYFIMFDVREGISIIDSLSMNGDFLFITVIPFLVVYNHQKGKSLKFDKYFFYAFYPLNL